MSLFITFDERKNCESICNIYCLNLCNIDGPWFCFLLRGRLRRGWIADRFGDHTARAEGRLTLNPLVHIDLFRNPVVAFVFCF